MEQPVPLEDPQAGIEGFSSFRLTLLVAPAGSGKTRLMRRWAARLRSEEMLVAWFSLQTDDNNPDRFWSDLLTVLNKVYPLELPEQAGDLELAMTSLINELFSLPGSLVLILDDYHTIENDAIHQAIRLLLDYPPTGLRLVIASRSQPPLQIPRLHARRQLLEISLSDFTIVTPHSE